MVKIWLIVYLVMFYIMFQHTLQYQQYGYVMGMAQTPHGSACWTMWQMRKLDSVPPPLLDSSRKNHEINEFTTHAAKHSSRFYVVQNPHEHIKEFQM